MGTKYKDAGPEPITTGENKRRILDLINGTVFQQQLTAALMGRLTPEFMVRCAVASLNADRKLLFCDPITVAACLLQLAQAGLAPEPNSGQAWLVPRKIHGRWQCTFLIGYKGYLRLIEQCDKIAMAHAQVVYENDEFDIDLGNTEAPRHKPWTRPTEGKPERGEVIGAFAVAVMANGMYKKEYMTADEIDELMEDVAPRDEENHIIGAWASDYPQMARKTPLRRLAKWVPDTNLQKLASLEETQDLGLTQARLTEDGQVVLEVATGGVSEEGMPSEATEPAIERPRPRRKSETAVSQVVPSGSEPPATTAAPVKPVPGTVEVSKPPQPVNGSYKHLRLEVVPYPDGFHVTTNCEAMHPILNMYGKVVGDYWLIPRKCLQGLQNSCRNTGVRFHYLEQGAVNA